MSFEILPRRRIAFPRMVKKEETQIDSQQSLSPESTSS
jgi:hypothetical protein